MTVPKIPEQAGESPNDVVQAMDRFAAETGDANVSLFADRMKLALEREREAWNAQLCNAHTDAGEDLFRLFRVRDMLVEMRKFIEGQGPVASD